MYPAIRSTLLRTLTVTILMASPAFAQKIAPSLSTVGEPQPAADAPALDFSALIDQLPKPQGPPPTPRHTGIKAMVKALGGDVKHLPSMTNLYWVGVGGGVSLAVHPVDDNVQQHMMGNETADKFFAPGRLFNTATLLGVAATTYTVGRVRDEPRVSFVGMDLLRSLAISQGLTQVLKYATRRERPDGSGKTSFPSGHAADTFAFATALERHVGWKYSIPGYLFASYVAASRLPSNRHWLSDITFGATVGIIAGRTVSRRGRDFPVTPVAVPGGIALRYSRQWPPRRNEP
jgi:membrane-associated phospholipid phosphatase